MRDMGSKMGLTHQTLANSLLDFFDLGIGEASDLEQGF